MKFNRRELLKNATLVSGATLVSSPFYAGKSLFAHVTLPTLPSPENSGIEHVVVVTMENRSFDHFLGWLPNADGKQAGLTYVNKTGVSHSTRSLSGDYTGCPHPSPDQ
jgi:phospholipase C